MPPAASRKKQMCRRHTKRRKENKRQGPKRLEFLRATFLLLYERRGEIALLDDAGNPFSIDKLRAGDMTPVSFGSAMNNFGVEPFPDRFVELCPSPLPRTTGDVVLSPTKHSFSAFVFKIQANIVKDVDGNEGLAEFGLLVTDDRARRCCCEK